MLVGYLGEQGQFAWWPTSFFDPSSHLFLEPIFARTLLTAQYHGVIEAGRRSHDEHLSAGAFHLFRLPEEMEQDLHSLVQAAVSGSLLGPPRDKDSALRELKSLSGSIARKAVGPSAIGSVREIAEDAKLQEIAAIYCASFETDSQAFPYFLQ